MVKNLHKLFALVLLCCAYFGSSDARGQEANYEPFNYTPGSNLGGQGGWVNVNSGDEVTIASGNLTYSNLKESTGSLVTFSGGGIDPQLVLPSATNSGWIYYSFIFRVNNLAGIGTASTDATYFAGFSSGTSNFASAVWVRKSGEGFNIGFSKRSNSEVTWQPEVYTVNENILIVGAYNLISGTANDFARVWINPAPASIGGNEPTPTSETALTGTDLSAVDRFFIRQDNNSKTPSIDFDELRIGTSWNSVTPAQVSTNTPAIVLSGSAINLGEQIVNATATGSYTLSARNLSGAVTVAATAPVEISKSADAGFSNSLTFTAQELASEQTVYVRATSATAGNIAGTITHTSEGATAAVVAVTGTFASPFAQDFSNCGTTLPGGWTAQSVTGDQVWACTTFGRTNNAVQINGFAGTSKNNEDWLISPKLDLSGFTIPLVSFWTRSAFVGPALKVMISTNYDGTSAPSTANWTELNVNLPVVGSDVWTKSEALLDAYKQTPIHIAFVYTSEEKEENGSSRWTLDDFKVEGKDKYLTSAKRDHDFGAVKAWTPEAPLTFETFKALGFTEPLVITSTSIDPTTQSHLDFEFSKTNLPDSYSNTITYSVEELNDGEDEKLYIRFLPRSTYILFQSNVKATSGDFNQSLGILIGSSILKESTLDVVTWNVEWFGADKDGDGAILGPTDDALQYQNVKKAMELMNADIYALQEIANDQMMEKLVAELPGYGFVRSDVYSYSLRPANFVSTPQKLYLVYKNETLKVKSEKVLLENYYKELLANTKEIANYPGGNDDAFWASGRLPYMVEFEATIEGVTQRLHVLNIHARANSGTTKQVVDQRRYDIQVLKDTLDAQYPNVNLIMLGDYNDDVDASVVSGIASSTYDIFVDDKEDYKVLTYELSQATTKGTYNQSSFLDHITVSSRLAKGYIENSIKIEEGLYTAIPRYHTTTSDHGPVSARLYLSATPVVAFTEATLTKTEGDAAFNVNLTLNEAQSVDQTVTISIAEGATASAADYTLTGAENGMLTVTIPANEKTASFEVSITDDNELEATEEVTFVISNTSALIGTGSKRTLKLTIEDNEKSTVNFAIDAQTMAEGDGSATVTMNLSSALPFATQVVVNVANGTGVTYGTAGDYVTAPAVTDNTVTVDVPAGVTTATFTVTANTDTEIETAETITFTLGTLGNGLVAGDKSTFVLTLDADKPNGIADETKGQFSAYPNPVPAGSTVRLMLPERVTAQTSVNLVVYSLDGRTALNVTGTVNDIQRQLNAKSANLPGGMYIMLVQAGKEYFQTKLIKQ